ncbi:NIMA-related kinase 2 [Alternaria panax]|uniref:non-specific serine/threonine protein kinase n=1 Tax=Alternaria panax TaxID=48097 RepID=A0AAD4IJ61_9PLEO|nr:NIMA-related kinase 2 [Alternaria panax]
MNGGLNCGISKVRCDNPSARSMIFIEKRFGKELFKRGIAANEIQILHQIQDHNHITKMVDHFLDESIKEGAVYMEYCDVGSMADVAQGVAQGVSVNEHKIWYWFYQVASALTYCHRGPNPDMSDDQIFQSGWSRIYHRDIKPGNILLTIVNGRVVAKLADFGFAITEDILALCPKRQEAIVQPGGTPGFFAPEMPVFSGASDIWQLGLSMICACTGIRKPRSREMPDGQKWNKARPAGPKYSVELSKVIEMCLEEHYTRRVQAYPLLFSIETIYRKIRTRLPTDKWPMMVFDGIEDHGKAMPPPGHRRPGQHYAMLEDPMRPAHARNYPGPHLGVPIGMMPFYRAGYHGDGNGW